ncbi:glycosyltransferase family 4 protein [Cryobacterium frigoriphilum]|uniref:Glycosyltransferase family 4 protein n=1 Tax=Cryobacterium frigoriphilum TaxID=1259150 RepID=A0A4R9A3D6_9MICO|nr:glycosyltransferase [Cryobacterium frigoriphilum]TFD50795.1 glycosyltransferase family 4 protein [Cryobacterium frigoriphilum]
MRIAVTTSILRIPPTYFVVDHAERLAARHEFRVFALAADVRDENVTVGVHDASPTRVLPFRYRMPLAPLALPLMARAVRRYHPDLVHQHFATWCTPAASVARALSVPMITTLHGYDVMLADRPARSALERWHRHNLSAATQTSARFLAVSEFLAATAVHAGFDSRRVHVHYQGVDTEYFAPAAPGPESDAHLDERPVVLFVGGLSPNKGPHDLIGASRRLTGTVEHQLILVGTGPLADELAADTAADKHIRLLGALDRTQIREWMRRATVVVLPAQEHRGRREAAGLVLLEAQACGTPVVAYASGGTPEMMLADCTGLLVPERDARALASAIGTVLRLEHSEYLRMAYAARDFVHTRRSLSLSCVELDEHYAAVADT